MTKFLRPFKIFSIVILLFFTTSSVFGQTPAVGDYRSNVSNAIGNKWENLSSWQRWNGTSWVTPTSAEGYPGQVASSVAVLIQAGQTITIGDGSATDFITLGMGTVTITGRLYLEGSPTSASNTPKFELDTQWVYVTPNTGIIEFNNKANLWVDSSANPGTAVLTVNKSSGYQSIIGDCTHNQDINFGPNSVSYCRGGQLTFDDLMSGGGSLNAAIAPVSPVCEGSTINLTGSYTGKAGIGGLVTYNWYYVDSAGNNIGSAFSTTANTTATVNNPGPITKPVGSYTIRLTVTTTYDTAFSNSETTVAVVNAIPSTPTATAGTVLNCTSIRANWQAVPGVTSYKLDVATDSGFTSMVLGYNGVDVGNVLFKDIIGLNSANTYYYRVRSYNGTCNSSNSNVITVPFAPATPSNLASVLVGCKQVDLIWDAVPGAVSYTVESAKDPGFSAATLVTINNIMTNGTTTTPYSVTGLSIGTNYYFRVRAVNNCKAGANSSTLAISTLDTTVQPTNVGVGTVLCAHFDVTWTGNSGAVDYTIEVSTDPAFPSTGLLSFTHVTASPFSVTGLSADTVYYYRVIAVNGCGNGTPVNGSPASVRTIKAIPAVPTGVGSSAIGCNQFTMNWVAATNADDYTVQLSTTSDFSSNVTPFSSIEGTSYTFTGLSAGTRYYYRVSARNGCGFSAYGVPNPVYVDTGTLPTTPIISPSGSTTICQANPVTLHSNVSSGNVVWSSGQTSLDITTNVAGNYTVQVVNPLGCVSAVSSPATVLVEGLPIATITGGPATICANGSATVTTATASNGTIQWTFSGGSGTLSNATSLTPTYTAVSADSGKTVTLTMTVFSNNSCAPISDAANYTVNVLPAPTAEAGGSKTICVDGSVTVNDASVNNGTILWTHDGAGMITNETTLTPTYTPAASDAGKTVTLTMSVTASPACTTAYVVKDTRAVFVSPLTTLSGVSQSAPVCNGSVATINLTGLVVNSTSTINYTINGASQTANGVVADASGNASFNTGALSFSNNGQILAITGVTNTSVTPNCSASSSQSATLSVLPSLPASVNIAASPAGPICEGTSVTFTATPTNEGATPIYQWKLNGNVVGSNLPTYTNSGLLNGDIVTCELTSNATPCLTGSPATSSPITMTVNPNLPASVSIAASPSNVVCAGTSVTFTATPTNGGSTPVYQWKLNGNDVGTNSATYTNSALANNDIITCVMTSNATPCLTGSPATSSPITMTVTPNASIASVTGTSPLCKGGTATYTANSVVLGGGTGSWTSSNTGIAMVDSSGLVTGIAAGNCNIIYTINGGCGTVNASAIIVINDKPTISLISTPAPLCEGVALNASAPTVNNNGATLTTFGWELETNVSSGAFASLTLPYTVTLADSGKNIRYSATNNCGTTYSNTVVLTVNAIPEQPQATPTQPTCVISTGSITVTSPLGAGLSYSIDNSDYTNTSGTFNNVAAGTYFVKAKNSSGCISLVSDQVLINGIKTTTWNGSGWDNGVPNNGIMRVVFSGNAIVTTTINACSCQVNSGVNVVVGVPGGPNVDAILKIENGLDVLGTLTFENNASLIQVNEAVNTGKISYRRISAPMKNFDFTYWCSPVLDQALNVLSPNTLSDKYLSYTGSGWVSEPGGSPMNPEGKGFAIRVPKPQFWPNPAATIYEQPVEFFGIPYNGSKTIAALGDGVSNLIGNPYPSALDADEFIKANSSLIRGTLNFWTHSTAIAKSGSFYVYDPNDYASYNLSGGTAATINGVIPNGKIAAGQSFFVISTSKNNFVFNNSMRNTDYVLEINSNSRFFRMSQTKKTAAIEKNRVWLNLSNSGGAFKQLLVGYIAGATNEIDNLYDGNSLNSNAYVDFYSINSGKNLVIQGRALPFTNTDEVPLGYKTTIQGDFTIGIGKTDGVLVNQDIFIEDKVAGTVTNLKNGSYTFSTATGVFNNRFVLKYIANGSISTISGKVTTDTVDKTVLVSVKDKQISINSLEDVIDKVMVYDLKSSLLYEKENVNSTEFSITNFNSAEQFLIVQVLLKNGKWVTKEIVF